MDNIDMSSLIDVYVIPWGIKIVLALAIFYIGRMVVSSVVSVVSKLMRGRGTDELLSSRLSGVPLARGARAGSECADPHLRGRGGRRCGRATALPPGPAGALARTAHDQRPRGSRRERR